MVKLRLRRMGAKKRPSYRIVAADSRSPRDGRFIEAFGFYDPITNPATIRVDLERARHWLSVGAQPTERVVKLMAREGLVEAPTYPAAPKEADGGAKAAPATEAPAAEAPSTEAPVAEASADAEPEAAASAESEEAAEEKADAKK